MPKHENYATWLFRCIGASLYSHPCIEYRAAIINKLFTTWYSREHNFQKYFPTEIYYFRPRHVRSVHGSSSNIGSISAQPMIPGVDNDVGEYRVTQPVHRVCEWNQVICKIDFSALCPTSQAENLMVSSLQLTLKTFFPFNSITFLLLEACNPPSSLTH